MWSASTFAHTHTNTHRHTDEDPQRNANNIEFRSYSCSHFRCLDFKVRFLFPPYLSVCLSLMLYLSSISLFMLYTFWSCFVFFYSFLFRIWWHISGSVLLIFRSIFGLVVHALCGCTIWDVQRAVAAETTRFPYLDVVWPKRQCW